MFVCRLTGLKSNSNRNNNKWSLEHWLKSHQFTSLNICNPVACSKFVCQYLFNQTLLVISLKLNFYFLIHYFSCFVFLYLAVGLPFWIHRLWCIGLSMESGDTQQTRNLYRFTWSGQRHQVQWVSLALTSADLTSCIKGIILPQM